MPGMPIEMAAGSCTALPAIKMGPFLRRHVMILMVISGLTACAMPVPAPEIRPEPAPVAPTNVTDPVEGSDALWIPAADGALLGEGVASLGDVTRPGAWVRAGFLQEDGVEVEIEADTPHGTVRIRVNGLKAEGTVQLSLAAYQALGLSPTTLPVIRVFSAGDGDAG